MHTTLNKILSYNPCGQEKGSGIGWDKLLTYLGKTGPDDEPLPILTILESNGLYDALWSLRATEGYDREIRLLACKYAWDILTVYEKKYPNDDRPRKTILTSVEFAEDRSTEEDLKKSENESRTAWKEVLGDTGTWNDACAVAWTADRVAGADSLDVAWDAAISATWTDSFRTQEAEFRLMLKQGHKYDPFKSREV